MSDRLTDALIEARISRLGVKSHAELTDLAEPGLRLRIGPEGACWSVMTYTLSGARGRVPVGAWPAVRVDAARAFAGALKATFQRARAPDEGSLSLGMLLERYEARRLSQLRKGTVIARALRQGLSGVLSMEAALIGRRDISGAIDGMAERAPIHANRVLAYAKAFFTWSVGRGYLDVSPATAITKPAKERPRDRAPGLEEVREIWKAAGSLGYPFEHAVRLLILTAMRRDEVGAIRREEIDERPGADNACWVLPSERSKNARAMRVPLAPQALRILHDARAAAPEQSALLLTTTGRTPVSGWSRAKTRLDKAIAENRRAEGREEEMTPWRIHDLRRSFATGACDHLRIDPVVADRCLNHVGASTTSTVARVYGRSEMIAQRRDALERWAALVTDEEAANEKA